MSIIIAKKTEIAFFTKKKFGRIDSRCKMNLNTKKVESLFVSNLPKSGQKGIYLITINFWLLIKHRWGLAVRVFFVKL